ncbi:hypothetical protein ACFY0F_10300 [Streptomyces sp. NPDC001544]|uniref:hypothetical protein n=1 Tax=Streptomyces sp. NPDC001544 TaxID=3364584 RepID=UPI0036C1F2C6
MSTVSWEETKRKARERRAVAGLPVRSALEKQAVMDRLTAEVRAYKLAALHGQSVDIALSYRV